MLGREHRRGGGAGRGGSPRPGRPPPLPRIVSVLQILARGRGMLSGSGAVRPGFGAPFLSGRSPSGSAPRVRPGAGFGGSGLVRLGGFGRVGCELHSGREHQECFLLFWFAAPLGPSFVLPVRSLVGGVGVGGRVCAARRVGWAGPSAVRAPVSDVRFVVVCCVLFVDF